MKKRRMIIIGGGLGGLALALRSVVNGWQVTVCERSPRLGGRMNLFEKGGFRFDTGPSLITLPHIFEDLFAAAGEKLSDHVAFQQLSPLAQYRFADGTQFHYPAPLPEWMKTIKQLEPRDVDGFWRFMNLGSKIYELSRQTFFSRSPYEPPSLNELKALRHFPVRYGWGNYAKTVAAHFHSPYLRQMYNRYPTYVGSSPYKTPATLAVIPYIEFSYGGWYVKGGLYSIVTAIEKLLHQRGVELRTRTTVTQILHQQKKATGVLLENGETLNADIVVMNGDVATMQHLLLSGSNDDIVQKKNEETSLSAVVFLVGLKKKIPSLYHHSLFFSLDYTKEFHQLFSEQKFPDDPTLYVNVSSKTDSTAAPKGCDSIFILANAPASKSHQWNETEIQRVWNVVKKKLEQNGIAINEADIAVREIWTPDRFAEVYGVPGGSIYGLASHSWKTTFFRPSNHDRNIKGMYYVGGSTHPGGGTPMVLLSASITSSLIERYEYP